ncbi:MAG TPA: cobalamin-binding protein [Bryobacterales bacterium]|nr:cobalamin-binding protein [Bryobacterales bacterium]
MNLRKWTLEALLRIITLIASATEIVCALGLREFLVGRSHECDYPESINDLPVCTQPRFEVTGSSREIDERVKSLAREAVVSDALGVYEVFPEKLRELQPTHIVTQAQCEVCAVSLRDVEIAVQKTAGCEATIISLQPNNMADFWASLCTAASHLGVTSAGVQLVAELQSRMESIESETRPLPLKARPSVACIEWVDPLMAAGNWTPELIHAAGGDSLFGEAGKHSPWMTFGELRQKDPAVIVVAPCGFDLARTRQDLPLLQAQPGWDELRAVRDGRVYLADGNQYFNRPGPRLVESLEILAEMLHPGKFRFGHEGVAWERA